MKSNNKSYVIWGVFILGTIALLWGLAKVGSNGPITGAGDHSTTGNTLSEPVNSGDNVKGNPEAEITLVEYSDFQCPACAGAAPAVKQLVEEMGEDVRVVYRHYPLRSIHPNAQLAAQASEAAANQGKFWEMHDELFASQRVWSNQSNPTDDFYKLAEKLELDMMKFKQDLTASETKNKVNSDYTSGSASGVAGTPTFYLDGEQLTNFGSYANLKSIIQDKLGTTPEEGTDESTTNEPTEAVAPKVKSAN